MTASEIKLLILQAAQEYKQYFWKNSFVAYTSKHTIQLGFTAKQQYSRSIDLPAFEKITNELAESVEKTLIDNGIEVEFWSITAGDIMFIRSTAADSRTIYDNSK